jgi:RHS repeat-associated protein
MEEGSGRGVGNRDKQDGASLHRRNALPSISLPKGGGALRSIDEKFAVNAANGTCDLTIPLPFSKTRSGLDSSLGLHYSSGSGNSAFGLGWNLGLPSIQRRTDQQLPRYEDEKESDVFLFSGAEDLVPAYLQNSIGDWVPDSKTVGAVTAARYRPRIEGGFSRIEKIKVAGESGFYWKVTSRENVVTVFGRTPSARIAAPGAPGRIFRWLPEWTNDDKGNCLEFIYKDEDQSNVPSLVEEKNRLSGLVPFTNKYIKRIRYGNTAPYYPDPQKPFNPPHPNNPGYLFETVFDYGEHDVPAPSPNEVRTWPCRFDPFSDCRSGFEIRSYRLCRRILFFHSFDELEFAPAAYLVHSLDLTYKSFHFDNAPYVSHEADLVTAVTSVRYKKTGPNTYENKAWPSLSLTYQELNWDKSVKTVSPEDVVGAPSGASQGYQWVDLYSEGVPGILTEQAMAWYYKSNLGNGNFERASIVLPKPSFTGVVAGLLQFQDLNADGTRYAVSLSPQLQGYFELTDENEWLPFRSFDQVLNIDSSDPNTKLLDLDGDGKPDLLISEEYVFRWYPSLGTAGYDGPEYAAKPFDEEIGPAVLFADGTETTFIADMNGDGLSDIVRIRNGEVCYWPNLGYGRFGAKVTMRNAPQFDSPEQFDPKLIQLGDISGTGAADLIYLGRGGFAAWINLAGNAWSDTQSISPFPGTEQPNRVSVLDILGNGTVSVVWSSELPANATAPLRYVDLMGGKKPYILSSYTNQLGKTIKFQYKSSSFYALLDKREGHPWATKLPIPSMCVARVETSDSVSNSLFVQEYRYRHGFYDHAEREFRGFGMVEQTDSETFDRFQKSGTKNALDEPVHQPPARTRTWFHLGAFINGVAILRQFSDDYYQGAANPESILPDVVLEATSPTPEELRQAARACKGMTLRQETYADDDSPNAAIPYSTAEHNCHTRMLQPLLTNRYAVFLSHESEALTYNYERDSADPRIAHELNTAIDELGNVVESASVVYGRMAVDGTLPVEVQAEQSRVRVTYTVRRYTNDVLLDSAYRLRVPCEAQTFELTGVHPAASCFTPEEIRSLFLGAAPLPFESAPHVGLTEKRLFRHERSLFSKNADVNQPLALGLLDPLGLPYENYRLAFTPTLLVALYAGRVDDTMLAEGKYIKSDDYKTLGLFPPSDLTGFWWGRSGTVQYPVTPEQHFYLPDRYVDPLGSVTKVHYFSSYHLLVDQVTDALTNTTTVLLFDFRFLLPQSVRDINDNVVDVSLDIFGLVVGTAIRGKGNEADDLIGFQPDLAQPTIDAFLADPVANGPALLQNATTRFVYSLTVLPVVAVAITRETHAATAVVTGASSLLRYSFEYSNGLGQVAMKKVQAEPGRAQQCTVNPDGTYTVTVVDTTPGLRWIGTGRTILNNKGKAVMQFEAYFSVTPAYEDAPQLVETGVTPVFYYDPVGRLEHTDFPDGTFSRVQLGAWLQKFYDQNDNVLASDWYAARSSNALGLAEQAAAQRTILHDNTPSAAHFDSLGRSVYTIEDNKFRNRISNLVQEEFYESLTTLDIASNRLAVRDARKLSVMRFANDMLNRVGASISMDAGQHHTLSDILGKPFYSWDSKGNRIHTVYDILHRPLQNELLTSSNVTIVYEKSEYGANKINNQNEKLVTQYDKSGKVTCDAYDFKGNLLTTNRTFTADYAVDIDWTTPAAISLQAQSFTTRNEYDALNRVIKTTSPDGSVTSMKFNEAGLLSAIDAAVRGGPPQAFVTRITHDAKGQRSHVDFANGASTDFTYDPLTFRVRRIHTFTASGSPSLQDLNYTYDPVGNVSQIRDAAQRTIFFNNQQVSPQNDFTYDAVYRLISATGREHVGQNAPVSRFDEFRTNPPNANDITALRNYLQQYDYDFAGNLLHMVHSSGTGPFTNQWTRDFSPNAANNRVDSSQVGALAEAYSYDVHGNLTSIPGMPALVWDFDDHFRSADLGGGGTAYYTYDKQGNRARKVVERLGGVKEERIYTGSVELFTRTQGAATQLQRWTLHVMDGGHRIALIDSRTAGNDGTPPQLISYQFSNHLGTAALELDTTASVISYEEYYPFGSTSFQGVDSTRTVPAKRYRYAEKERDEETGLYYYGARYYAPWISRWISADPHGIEAGTNFYSFVQNNPIKFYDPDGGDVRLSVDQQSHTITYATVVHFFGTKAEIKQLSPVAAKAEKFFKNPRIETENETFARMRGGASGSTSATKRQPTFTDNAGTVWTVKFDVKYQLHDIAKTPPAMTSQDVDTAKGATAFVTGRAAAEQKLQQSFGYAPGENVMTYSPPAGSVGGVTTLLSSVDARFPTFGMPESRMFSQITKPARFDADSVREALIHETGHLLGFDERYRNMGPLSSTHADFKFDLMAAGVGRSEIVMHPQHIEEAGRFGVGVANGRTLVDQPLRGIQIDSTGQGGNIPLLDSSGQANPAYQPRQALVQSELVPQFAAQVTGTVPAPVFSFPAYRPWICIPP